MRIFVTGTDTDVGKTTICSWLCLHSGYAYFKPIQTGSVQGTDSNQVSNLTNTLIYKEAFMFKEPLSPHVAANLENSDIDIGQIDLPKEENIIIEGAGGILVPINKSTLMVDLIKLLGVATILVARSTLGTINHTLLSLEALRRRDIPILGVILNGPENKENLQAIEFYGGVKVLATVPQLKQVDKEALLKVPLSIHLREMLAMNEDESSRAR
ncbi:unnamed protein product [Bemisia tabaci]|uniref:Dependent dethiobiotin synthetase n=2 Tax=Bemisia tabaci TaxID=7038 RepID=A0A7G4WFP7_BEMTA|nr:PREDICTED: uncharacterized protein LOC109035785 [Bemisia tabaci]QMU23984.1 dependent dethiobiotin synthetase [Bemisia tabaci]CAH0382596.1 unnamed protein product [Bemisia tabaci]